MNVNSARRINRTDKFEEWRLVDEKHPFTDTVLIYFGKSINKIILVTSQPNVEQNQNYLFKIVNLVHDLEVDFTLTIEYVNIDQIRDDIKVTDMIYEKTEEIKKINHSH